MSDQIEEEFGVPAWEWTRIKIVYERFMEGNDYAGELIEKIDRGEITPSGAYRLLNQHRQDAALGASIPTIKLRDLLGRMLSSQAYVQTVTAAARSGAKINRGGMTGEEVSDLLKMVRANASSLNKLAKILTAATSEGSKNNGQSGNNQ